MDFTAAVETETLVLASRKRGERFLELPATAICDVSVGETTSGMPNPRWELAIMIRIPGGLREVTLPVVPVDERGRSLTWNDAEVWRLARGLATQLGVPLVARPGR
ncbi:MAG: hypothetical protein QM598_04750 [Protaetiibacter sp.]